MKRKIQKEIDERERVEQSLAAKKKVDETTEELITEDVKKAKEEEDEIEIIECPGIDGARNRNQRGARGFRTRIVS